MTRRLLIVSPAFHRYWESIERSFQRLGYEARTCRYDERRPLQKLRYKAAIELPGKLGADRTPAVRREVTDAALSAVAGFRPDVVLAVKGDLLTDAFHTACRDAGARTAVWIYDELRNTTFTRESVERFDGVASYSAKDTATLNGWGVGARFVQDAYDPELPFTVRHTPDIVQIGALYPAREHALRTLQGAGLRVRSYGREWSRHPVDVARTWGSRRPPVPSGREMSRSDALGLMAGAPAALNIHGSHDGFNMRTFEAAGAGAVQLIDRTDVADLYEPGTEILPYASDEELIDLARRAVVDDRWGDAIRSAARKRTLAEHTFVHRARELEELWA